MAWDDDLNGETLEFASATEQRIRCLAGPGTGKTFALMRRVQRLLEEGVAPERILVVTLTRTAADDLRRSLAELGFPGAADVYASTLHALCFSILSRDAVFEMTGRSTRILANFERDILLKDLPDDLGNFTQKRRLLAQYEAAWASLRGHPLGAPAPGLPQDFQDELLDSFRWHRCMLVGELVPLARAYLTQNPYAPDLERFDHVLVDEYQDLNRADQQVIDRLADRSVAAAIGQLAIIGDDDQSIYVMLRNAHPQGMVNFQADRDSPLLVCLRCPQRVVSMAQALIERNPGRLRGPLLPLDTNPEGEIHNVVFETMEKEAEGLANFIHHRINSGQVGPGEVLVLANWREIAYGIRDRLAQLGHVAHSYFSEQALDTPNARRVLTLITLLGKPDDRVSLRSWLALSDTRENRAAYRRILAYAQDNGVSAAEVLQQLRNEEITIRYTPRAIEAWNDLTERLEQLQPLQDNVAGVVEELLPEGQEDLRLLRSAALRALDLLEDPNNMASFAEEIRRQIGVPEVPLTAPFVRLMSLHKSKGLKADLVVIAGLVQGLIPRRPDPSYTREERTEHRKEQRRVLYVGITRTTQTLVLSKFQRILSGAAHVAGVSTGRWVGSGVRSAIASSFMSQLGPELPRAVRGDRWEYD